MIISIVTPRNYNAPWPFVKSLVKVARDFKVSYREGPSVADNRAMEFEKAKALNEHLLFIDADMVFEFTDVLKIERHLEEGLDAVSGVYVLGEPYPFALFRRVDGDYEHIKPQDDLHKIDASGTGFLGINKKVFEKLPKRPFEPVFEGGIKHGTDISFCHRLRQAGFQLWCDGSIKLGHVRPDIKRA